MHETQKMCMMCMTLSPNCCAVTIFEYSTTEVTLPSRFRPHKSSEEEEKYGASVIPR